MLKGADIAKSLKASLDEGQDVKAVSKNFFSFVEKFNLWHTLPAVVEALSAKTASDEAEVVVVRASHPLTKTSESDIRRITGAGSSTPVEYVKDDEVVGGFIARYKGREFEGSFGRVIGSLKKMIQE
ncbi:MAG: F0F1 ATP synthase subunit delta [Candidatus Paceibacterota bacterium]